MFKKLACIALSLMMVLSTISVTGFAKEYNNGNLVASHVTFTEDGKATINVKNVASEGDAETAVFWLGEYVEGVLVEAKFKKLSVAPGADSTEQLSVTKDENSVLKAYIWRGVVNGKAIAPAATYPSSSTEIKYAMKNGAAWADFKADKYEYDIVLERTVYEVPQFAFYAADNSTAIAEPLTYTAGENVVTVTAADGTEVKYTINIDYKAPEGFRNVSSPSLSKDDIREVYPYEITDDNMTRYAADAKIMEGTSAWNGYPSYSSSGTLNKNGPIYEALDLLGHKQGELYTFKSPKGPDNVESWYAGGVGKYDGTDGGYFLTFDIESPGTMYLVLVEGSTEPFYRNFVEEGYLLHDKTLGSYPIYYKHFNIGETVKVPCMGWDDTWGDPATVGKRAPGRLYDASTYFLFGYDDTNIIAGPFNKSDTSLKSLTYTVDGRSAAVDGFDTTDAGGEYEVSVPNGTETITVSAEKNETFSSMEISATEVTIADGTAEVTVTVTAYDGTTATYKVKFTELPPTPDNGTLKALTYKVGDGAWTPVAGFNKDVYEYTAPEVDYAEGGVSIQIAGELTVDGDSISGTLSETLTNEEEKILSVTATSADGTLENTYTVKFTMGEDPRAAALKTLSYKINGALTKPVALEEGVTTYTVDVPSNVESVELITEVFYAETQVSSAVDLANKKATVTVTAPDGETTSEYIINLNVLNVPFMNIASGDTAISAANTYRVYDATAYGLATASGEATATYQAVIDAMNEQLGAGAAFGTSIYNTYPRAKENKLDNPFYFGAGGDAEADYIIAGNSWVFKSTKGDAPTAENPGSFGKNDEYLKFDVAEPGVMYVIDANNLGYQGGLDNGYQLLDGYKLADYPVYAKRFDAGTVTVPAQDADWGPAVRPDGRIRESIGFVFMFGEDANLLPSTDAKLKTLKYGEESVELIDGTYDYAVELPYGTTVIPEVTYEVNSAGATVEMTTDAGVTTLVVTAEDGVTQLTYTLTLTINSGDSDATLKTLKYGDTEVTLVDGTYAYTATVPYGTTVLPEVTYVVNMDGATAVKTTDAGVTTIVVTARDGVTQLTYTLTITEESASSDATLKSLKYGDTDVTLVEGTYAYTAVLPHGSALPEVTYEVNDANATAVKTTEANVTTIVVTAQDGSIKTYTLTITIAPAAGNTDATLMTLSYKINGALTYPISLQEGVTTYTVDVPSNTESIDLIATANDENAVVAPAVGDLANKKATLRVTAEDAVTTIDYVVNLNVLKVPFMNIVSADSVISAANTYKVYSAIGTVNGTDYNLADRSEHGTERSQNQTAIDNVSTLLGGAGAAQGTSIYNTYPAAKNTYVNNPLYFGLGGENEATYIIDGDSWVFKSTKGGAPTAETPGSFGKNDEYLKFDVAEPGVMYVIDANNLGYEGGLDNGYKLLDGYKLAGYQVYAKRFDAGTVTVPAQDADWGPAVRPEDGRIRESIGFVFMFGEDANLLPSSDATLKTLKYGDTDVALVEGTYAYTAEIPYGSALPEVTYEFNNAYATAEKTTVAGVTTIVVTAEDGTTQLTYTLTFNEGPASSDATLKSLKYGEQSVTLVEGTYEYAVELPFGSTLPEVTYELNDATATAVPTTVAGVTTIVVTAQDGTTQLTYKLTITIDPGSSDATLKSLKYGGEPVTLVDGTYDYAIELPYGTTVIPEVTYEVNDANATAVKATEDGVTTIVVTAQNGSTKTYTLTITVSTVVPDPSLALESVTVNGENVTFNGIKNCYYIEVDSSVSSATVEATASSQYASVSYTPGKVTALSAGVETTVTVTVISATTETKDYTVKILRKIVTDFEGGTEDGGDI